MTEEDVDKVLKKASGVAPPIEPALLKRIADSINSSLRPVHPLPPTWVMAGGLALICAVVAVTAAARTGFYGAEKLSPWDRVLIFSTLGFLVGVAGREFVGRMIPGSRQRGVIGFLITICVALLVVFALVFHDRGSDHFISAGIACLLTGVFVGVPAALLSWLLLRRGFAVNPVAAGLTGGTLTGLCGVTMLELHCANFQALHVLAWHTAVVPVCAAAGALMAWAGQGRWSQK